VSAVEVTLGSLVDRTLYEVQGAPEIGKAVALYAAMTASDTTLKLVDGASAHVSDLIEFGSELMLVTAKTADAIPEFTVARAYYGSTASAHLIAATGIVNPQWPRRRIGEAIRRSFPRLEALGVPLIQSKFVNPEPGEAWASLPAETREVLAVRLRSLAPLANVNGAMALNLMDLGRWHFIQDLPLSDYPYGNALLLRSTVTDDTELFVTYRVPYRWSSHPAAPSETSTIDIPEGAEDLPCAYAAAWLLAAREVSRSDLDRAEEWAASEPVRGGASGSMVRAKWQEFYRALDEARRLNPTLPTRPYVRRVN